jgi:hypothetical protein
LIPIGIDANVAADPGDDFADRLVAKLKERVEEIAQQVLGPWRLRCIAGRRRRCRGRLFGGSNGLRGSLTLGRFPPTDHFIEQLDDAPRILGDQFVHRQDLPERPAEHLKLRHGVAALKEPTHHLILQPPRQFKRDLRHLAQHRPMPRDRRQDGGVVGWIVGGGSGGHEAMLTRSAALASGGRMSYS